MKIRTNSRRERNTINNLFTSRMVKGYTCKALRCDDRVVCVSNETNCVVVSDDGSSGYVVEVIYNLNPKVLAHCPDRSVYSPKIVRIKSTGDLLAFLAMGSLLDFDLNDPAVRGYWS